MKEALTKTVALVASSIVIAGCVSDGITPAPIAVTKPPIIDSSCPIISSDGWGATLTPGEGAAQTPVLLVTGTVELVNNLYGTEMARGPLDRRSPPLLRIILTVKVPEQNKPQATTTREIAFSTATTLKAFRGVHVICGTKRLAEIGSIAVTP